MRWIALLLLLVTGCGGYSQNHRRGLVSAGAAAVLIGGVTAIDGVYCDDSANGDLDCDNDQGTLITGLAILAAGLAVGGVALWLEPRDEATTVKAPAVTSAPQRP